MHIYLIVATIVSCQVNFQTAIAVQSGRQQLASGFWSLVGPLGVALGDLNGNGFLDLATANEPSNTSAIMQGLGDGSFEVDTIYSFAGGTAVELGGINLDGYRDSSSLAE